MVQTFLMAANNWSVLSYFEMRVASRRASLCVVLYPYYALRTPGFGCKVLEMLAADSWALWRGLRVTFVYHVDMYEGEADLSCYSPRKTRHCACSARLHVQDQCDAVSFSSRLSRAEHVDHNCISPMCWNSRQ